MKQLLINHQNFLNLISTINSVGYKVVYIFYEEIEFVFIYTAFNPKGLTNPVTSVTGQDITSKFKDLINSFNWSGDSISQTLFLTLIQNIHFSDSFNYINFIQTIVKN